MQAMAKDPRGGMSMLVDVVMVARDGWQGVEALAVAVAKNEINAASFRLRPPALPRHLPRLSSFTARCIRQTVEE